MCSDNPCLIYSIIVITMLMHAFFRIHRLVATDTGNTAAAAIATAAATYTVDAVVVFTFIPSSLQLLSLRATSFYGVFFNLFLV